MVQRGPECALHPLEFGGSENLEGVGLGHSTGLHEHELGIAGVSLGHQVVKGPLEPDSPGLILYCQDLLLHAQGRPAVQMHGLGILIPFLASIGKKNNMACLAARQEGQSRPQNPASSTCYALAGLQK